ncbi:hypothetical protein HN51_016281 [Arachis hypogaea]
MGERTRSLHYSVWCQFIQLVQISEASEGHFGEGDVAVLHTTDSDGKYVILEEMDEQDI